MPERLHGSLETGDTRAAYDAVAELYRAHGAEPRTDLVFRVVDYRQVMCWYRGNSLEIQMTRMIGPDEGPAFWKFWSEFATGGRWDAAASFESPREMQLLANYLMVTLIAHEMGHHLRDVYGIHGEGFQEELGADRLALGILDELAKDPRFARLRDRFHRIWTIELVRRIPDDRRIEYPDDLDLDDWNPELPQDTLTYVSMHLARQRLLLQRERPSFAEVVRKLQEAHARRFETRAYSGRACAVETLRRVPSGFLYCVDPDGRLVGAGEKRPIELTDGRRLEGTEAVGPISNLACRPGEVYFTDFEKNVWVHDAKGLRKIASFPGTLDVLVAPPFALVRDLWEIAAWDLDPLRERFRLKLSTDFYADGPSEKANLWAFGAAVDRNGTFYFGDLERRALRELDARGVRTLAGSIDGVADGTGRSAKLSCPRVLGCAGDDVYFLDVERDDQGPHFVLRRARLR